VGTLDATEGGNAEGGSLYTWNISEKSLSAPEKAHEGRSNMTALVYAHGGNMFATASMDATVIVWDAATLKPLQRLTGHASTVRALDFSPNDKRIVTGSDDKTFKIWDVATGKQIFTVQDAAVTADLQVARPTQVAFSADGLHLATITEPPVSPMILHAFSIDTATYPDLEEAAPAADTAGGADEAVLSDSAKAALQLEKQLEAYKRLYWRK
jgi:WD40 repeat protein